MSMRTLWSLLLVWRAQADAAAGLATKTDVASVPASALVYADVQSWIDAEPALRGGVVTRWRTPSHD